MIYLTALDLKSLIKDEHLSIINQSDNDILKNMEITAKDEMCSYLADRYNTDKIFIDVSPWSGTKNYVIGDHAYDATNKKVRKAKQDHTNQPINSDTYWEDGDDRNKAIVMYLADMTIYHLYSSINPRNIPELRGIRYDAAKQWLRDVARLIVNPELPTLTEATDRVSQITYGGNQKRNLRY